MSRYIARKTSLQVELEIPWILDTAQREELAHGRESVETFSDRFGFNVGSSDIEGDSCG